MRIFEAAAHDVPVGDLVAHALVLERRSVVQLHRAGKIEGVRDKIADWYVMSRGLKYSHFRTMTALSRGETPGPESSIGKLVSGRKLQDMSAFAMDLLEQGGVITDPKYAPMAALFQQTLMTSPSSRIAGGSDEILRNIIAERVLGLPPDIRVDKDLPFNQVPTGPPKK